MAIRQFEAGPASATITSPLRRSRRFAGLTGVGFAQPKMNPLRAREITSSSAAERVEMDDRVERQPAEQLGGPVAQA